MDIGEAPKGPAALHVAATSACSGMKVAHQGLRAFALADSPDALRGNIGRPAAEGRGGPQTPAGRIRGWGTGKGGLLTREPEESRFYRPRSRACAQRDPSLVRGSCWLQSLRTPP